MDLQRRYEKAKQLLDVHNQSHLLNFWDELDEVQCQKLLTHIEKLDFTNIEA